MGDPNYSAGGDGCQMQDLYSNHAGNLSGHPRTAQGPAPLPPRGDGASGDVSRAGGSLWARERARSRSLNDARCLACDCDSDCVFTAPVVASTPLPRRTLLMVTALLATTGVAAKKVALSKVKKTPAQAKVKKRRVLSPEARKRIADAQRKRWAAQKAKAK